MKDFKVKDNMYVVFILLIICSLWINYNNYNQINRLRDDLFELQYEINDIGENVKNSLDNFAKESKWIRDASFNTINFTDDLQSVELEAVIKLNERKKNEKLYIVAIPKDGSENIRFDVACDDLIIKVQMRLPATSNYDMQLVGENKDFNRSGVLDLVDVNEYKNNIIKIEGEILGGEHDANSKKGSCDFFVAISQMLKNNPLLANYLKDLEIVEVKADVYYGEKYAKTIDFLKETHYTPMDIEDITSAISEIIRREHKKKYFFSGRCHVEGALESQDIILLVKVKDNKGNIYKQILGDDIYPEEIKKKLLQ